jgi:hypothetical protein
VKHKFNGALIISLIVAGPTLGQENDAIRAQLLRAQDRAVFEAALKQNFLASRLGTAGFGIDQTGGNITLTAAPDRYFSDTSKAALFAKGLGLGFLLLDDAAKDQNPKFHVIYQSFRIIFRDVRGAVADVSRSD